MATVEWKQGVASQVLLEQRDDEIKKKNLPKKRGNLALKCVDAIQPD